MSNDDFNTQGRLIPRAVAKKQSSPIHSNELNYVIEEPEIKSVTHTMKTYVLELNEKEATWLRGVMQNPLHNQSPAEETELDSRMRKAFFGAVFGAGNPNGGN